MRIYTLVQIPCHTRSPLLYIHLGYQIIWFPKLPSIENNVKWIIIDFSSNFTFTLSFVHHKNYVIQVKGGSAGILEKLKLLSEGVLPNSSHCRVGHYKQINIVNMISRWHRVPKLRTNGKRYHPTFFCLWWDLNRHLLVEEVTASPLQLAVPYHHKNRIRWLPNRAPQRPNK